MMPPQQPGMNAPKPGMKMGGLMGAVGAMNAAKKMAQPPQDTSEYPAIAAHAKSLGAGRRSSALFEILPRCKLSIRLLLVTGEK